MNYVIASSKGWFRRSLKRKFLKKKNFYFINKKEQLNLKKIKRINPKLIFFPHWSHIVPKKIIRKYECVCFHTAPLPFGRGGSPIQNLIKRKIKKSPVCALKMTKVIDGGPIYIRKNISFHGSLDDIFDKISKVIQSMILSMIKKKPKPKKQIGRTVVFKRLKPKDSILKKKGSLVDIYDQIRMLDNYEYPRALIINGKFKVEFKDAKLEKNLIKTKALIYKFKK